MPDSAARIGQAAARAMLSVLQLVSKQNYQHPIGCQANFETLLYLEEAIMSARETAELLLLVGRLVQADSYEGELSPAQWMALRSPAPTRSPGPHRPSRNF